MTVTWRSLGAKPGTKCYCFPGPAEPSGGSLRLVSQPAQRLSTANNGFSFGHMCQADHIKRITCVVSRFN